MRHCLPAIYAINVYTMNTVSNDTSRYNEHEDLTLDILNSDEDTDAEEVKCVKIIRNSTEPYNSASLHR